MKLAGSVYLLAAAALACTPAAGSFPGGKNKAVILSFDDGVVTDRALVERLNRLGLKATFHLNSDLLDRRAEWLPGSPPYLAAAEVRSLFAGHEIGLHTAHHLDLTQLDLAALKNELVADQQTLSALAGYPVTSLAWPFGRWAQATADQLAQLDGLKLGLARTIDRASDFFLPSNWLAWAPTAHFWNLEPRWTEFLTAPADRPQVFVVWGHSWEINDADPQKNGPAAEQVFSRLAGRPDIWYTTLGAFRAWAEQQP